MKFCAYKLSLPIRVRDYAIGIYVRPMPNNAITLSLSLSLSLSLYIYIYRHTQLLYSNFLSLTYMNAPKNAAYMIQRCSKCMAIYLFLYLKKRRKNLPILVKCCIQRCSKCMTIYLFLY